MRIAAMFAVGALALAAGGAAQSQDVASPEGARAPAAVSGPPAGFVAPPEPRPDESNAERARSQPGNNAPFWRGVHNSGRTPGFTDQPGAEKGVLVQRTTQYPGSRLTTAGEAWRQVRNRWILPYGGALLAIVVLALALFHWRKGPIGGHERDTGRRIERFTPFERAAHWSNAIAFVVLAASGLVMAFGKFVILPVIGATLFGALTYALKTAHNFVGPLFAVSLAIVFVTFVRDNVPRGEDLVWLKKGGGLLGAHEVPSHRFNAGEKVVFWFGVFALGLAAVASGLVLDRVVPGLDYLRATMQVAHMVHAVAAILMMTLFLGHIYIGTLGMKGAYAAMRHGWVDEGWAQAHHELWYDDIRAGNLPARRSPGEAPAAVAGRPA